MNSQSVAQNLEQLFGSFRAESLHDDIYKLFNEPEYFYYLAAPKSCVLLGGRGSGKTTALKCLSYEGQAALKTNDFSSPSYVGLYSRINTNTVASFSGAELPDATWNRVFGHFINLVICEEAAAYIRWLKQDSDRFDFDKSINYRQLSRALGVAQCQNLDQFIDEIESARIELEIYINNFDEKAPTFSPLQTPIDLVMRELRKLTGHAKTNFFIILDEYENLLDYQQRLVNTLIKHAGGNYYFKIGVRELGWRERATLNPAEVLISPADYERIRIEETLEKEFPSFARRVCEARLQAVDLKSFGPPIGVDMLLPGLSIKEESLLLGVSKRVADFKRHIAGDPKLSAILELHDHELFVFLEMCNHDFAVAIKDLKQFAAGTATAKQRYENYAYSFLFSISGKGAPIPKMYCGHAVLAKITHQNIRFYMQLVNECIREQISAGKTISEPIDPHLQTTAARKVGLSYLRELEGVSTQGGSLAKLLLGLGRVFQLLASNPVGGKPECNQFELTSKPGLGASEHQAEALLTEAVMHLALTRTPGTKLTTETDIRSWDYAPHPIFAPYFGFSHRRKRKMSVSEDDLISLTYQPQDTIKKILGRRFHLADEALPAQMSMFDEYFR
ncbi:ATP-binding protein [Agrobacterium sp. CMT1]|uniref:ATP-binding protein n=1 Tax=Agrobacterium sp. CMT1 TaxID=3128901 RepID=UPI0030789773